MDKKQGYQPTRGMKSKEPPNCTSSVQGRKLNTEQRKLIAYENALKAYWRLHGRASELELTYFDYYEIVSECVSAELYGSQKIINQMRTVEEAIFTLRESIDDREECQKAAGDAVERLIVLMREDIGKGPVENIYVQNDGERWEE